jgi:multiple sugar transport system permease protein
LFVSPLLVALAATVIYPVVYNTMVAFQRYDAARDVWSFAGLSNFEKLLRSPLFWQSFQVTIVWVLGSVVLQFLIGMAVALALNRIGAPRRFLGGLFIVPWISSYVIVAVLWLWIYHPQLGVLNDLLLRLRVVQRPVAWLASPTLAMPSLIVTNVWKFFPIVTVTLLAGMQSIPREFYEVAEVEGATRWRTLRHVTLPTLAPSISAAVMICTIWAFNSFTLPFMMTGGGPLRSTNILGLYIYQQAFESNDFGAAAAAAIFLFLTILGVVVLYLRSAKGERSGDGLP